MTQVTKTQIPNNINTIERLLLWCSFILQKNNPTKAIVEQPNTDPINVATVTQFRADDQSLRILSRIDLEIESDYAESTLPLWLSAKELSNTAIPQDYQQS